MNWVLVAMLALPAVAAAGIALLPKGSDEQAKQRVEHLMGQDAGGSEPPQGEPHLLERRKQTRWKQAGMRDDLPREPHNEERKGSARTDMPAAFGARRAGRGDHVRRSGGSKPGHADKHKLRIDRVESMHDYRLGLT